MKKNGFTLIELLATIAILGIILTISTVIVVTSLNDAKEDANVVQEEMLKSAAKAYFLDNISTLTSGCSNNSSCNIKITSQTLVDNGYFDKKPIDKTTNEEIDYIVNVSLILNSNGNITKETYNVQTIKLTLAEKILKNSFNELNKINNVYYFAGSNPNNYITIKNGLKSCEYHYATAGYDKDETITTYSDLKARIVGINSDGSIYAISEKLIDGYNLDIVNKIYITDVLYKSDSEINISDIDTYNYSVLNSIATWEESYYGNSYLCNMSSIEQDGHSIDVCKSQHLEYYNFNNHTENSFLSDFVIASNVTFTGSGTSSNPYVITDN